MPSYSIALFIMPKTTFCLHDTDFASISIGALFTIGVCQSCLVQSNFPVHQQAFSTFGGDPIASPASSVVNAGSKSLMVSLHAK